MVSTTQGGTDAKDTSFSDLGTAIGNLDIGSQATTRSGTGESTTTNGLSLGFHDLTTSYQTILKLTSDNTFYTSNTVEIFAKLDAAVGTATVMTIKMVATDASADDQYTVPNTVTAARQVKDTPQMVTNYFSITPNNTEGLTTVSYGTTLASFSNTTT